MGDSTPFPDPAPVQGKQSDLPERLRQGWLQGGRPDVCEFLAGFDGLSPAQVAAVLRVDQTHRWQSGECVPAETYLRQHPGVAADFESALDLIYGEYLLRERGRGGVSLPEFLARFPEHAAILRMQVELHEAVVAPQAAAGPPLPRDPAPVEGESSKAEPQLTQEHVAARPPATASDPACEKAPARAARPALPVLAGYDVLAEVGRGGMGVIYKARQVELNRLVALKMISAGDLAGPADLARFQTEAEAVARMHHPHVVQIYEVGRQDGLSYLALEFMDGGSLAARLAGRPLAPRHAAELIETLARAVEAAHGHGIIHRDLKPANVLLTAPSPAGNGAAGKAAGVAELLGVPKITDFGLAKCHTADAGQTTSGTILGTPSYMAPEQAEGKTRHVGPAADVYALGAILYETLTGRPPFVGATLLETLMLVRGQEPVSPGRLQPSLPRDLVTICLKALAKEPQRRYGSALALAEDLRRFQGGLPVLARPIPAWERAWRWCRRNPAVAGLLAVAAGLLAGGTAVSVYFAVQASARAEEAQTSAANERRGRDVAEDELYLARMSQAQTAWDNNNVTRVHDLLGRYRHPRPGRRDLRGWEWFLQDRLCRGGLLTMQGDSAGVEKVVFSPDGKWLATGGRDNVVILWDADSGQKQRTLVGHARMVKDVAFSPDGLLLASASWDKTVKIWDAASGQELRTLRGHTSWVTGVAFSPDGTRLASSGFDQTARVWRVSDGRELFSLRGSRNSFYGLAYHPDGTRIALLTDGTAEVWDLGSRLPLRVMSRQEGPWGNVAFSKDGKLLASSSEDLTVRTWEVASGQPLRTFKGHTNDVDSVAFSPDGTRLASTSSDQTVKLWDAASGEELRTFKGHAGLVRSAAFSPDGTRLASASRDGAVKVWDLAEAGEPRTLQAHTKWVPSIAFSPVGTRLASSGADGTVKIWDTVAWEVIHTLKGHEERVKCVAYSPDGKQVASAGKDRTVRLWDVASGKQRHVFEGFTGEVFCVSFSPDGTRLASGTADGKLRLWDLGEGREVFHLRKHRNAISCVTFSLDGARLASASWDNTVVVWDANSGEELCHSKGHTDMVTSVAFSPDGLRLVSASSDKTMRTWDAATGRKLLTLQGHGSSVQGVTFSPDGTRLASAGSDKTVRVWDAASGEELRTLRGYPGPVSSVAFGPNGWLLASSSNEVIKVWDAAPRRGITNRAGADPALDRGSAQPVRRPP